MKKLFFSILSFVLVLGSTSALFSADFTGTQGGNGGVITSCLESNPAVRETVMRSMYNSLISRETRSQLAVFSRGAFSAGWHFLCGAGLGSLFAIKWLNSEVEYWRPAPTLRDASSYILVGGLGLAGWSVYKSRKAYQEDLRREQQAEQENQVRLQEAQRQEAERTRLTETNTQLQARIFELQENFDRERTVAEKLAQTQKVALDQSIKTLEKVEHDYQEESHRMREKEQQDHARFFAEIASCKQDLAQAREELKEQHTKEQVLHERLTQVLRAANTMVQSVKLVKLTQIRTELDVAQLETSLATQRAQKLAIQASIVSLEMQIELARVNERIVPDLLVTSLTSLKTEQADVLKALEQTEMQHRTALEKQNSFALGSSMDLLEAQRQQFFRSRPVCQITSGANRGLGEILSVEDAASDKNLVEADIVALAEAAKELENTHMNSQGSQARIQEEISQSNTRISTPEQHMRNKSSDSNTPAGSSNQFKDKQLELD